MAEDLYVLKTNENQSSDTSFQVRGLGLDRKQEELPTDKPEYKNEIKRDTFLFFKRRPPWSQMPDRKIMINIPDNEVPGNKINTSKYKWISFIPANLFEQFSKIANIYFLIIGFLQIVPPITNTDGQPTIFVPLVIIVMISMVKDFFEDLKRHLSDREENNRSTLVFMNGDFQPSTWASLCIGNIIKVNQNDYFPADILLLKSSEPKGVCFIETKNLDGETNLKQKKVEKDICSEFMDERMIGSKNHWFNYEKPNPYLYNFTGNLQMTEGRSIPLDHQCFVLRGCSLRNTKFIIGVVAYTGHDTKIMLNSVKAKSKRSSIEKMMAKQIFLIFILQLLFCVACSLYGVVWNNVKEIDLDYLEVDAAKEDTDMVSFLVGIGSWILLYTNFVPISLLVTLEMVKFLQAVIISKDNNLISKPTKTPTTVQSSNLNEELGQVEYIFSDKTGTLTCNIMEFKNMSIGGMAYGYDRSYVNWASKPSVTNVDFKDALFFSHLEDEMHSNYENIVNAMRVLSLCHTIITEEKGGQLIYNASSPDELALVNYAKFCGFQFCGLDEDNNMMIRTPNGKEQYKLLHILEFNSTRKRMSVILRDKDNKIILMTKGADSIILERMVKPQAYLNETWKQLEDYAQVGLRTLVLAQRSIPEKEYVDWARTYHEACTAITEREHKMEMIQELIEKNLILVGATAIEDKLQDKVGETIASLKKAGIKVWVLTGDKIETAINIGYSCQLLNDNLEQILVDGKEEQQVSESLEKGLHEMDEKKMSQFALVISGDALIWGMKEEKHSKRIMKIAEKCEAVVACRVSPKQKQEVVTLVRKNKPKAITLAIGDGANDVNMITAAHVGIGIKGVEGQQAVRASDYAIGEFKLLRRLLFYVGRECYRRNSYLIFYNFYKNMVLTLPHFWYAFLNGFSGQLLYDMWIFQFFNLFYTSLPIIIYALFDEEFPNYPYLNPTNYPPNLLETNPSLYCLGLKNQLFNAKQFWFWIVNGTWQAVLITFLSYYPLEMNFSHREGKTVFFTASGMMIFTSSVLLSNFKILLITNTYYTFAFVIIFGSIAFYFINLAITNALIFLDSYNMFTMLFSVGGFYLGSFLIVVATIMFDLGRDRYIRFSNSHQRVVPMQKTQERQEKRKQQEREEIHRGLSRKYTGFAFSFEDKVSRFQMENFQN